MIIEDLLEELVKQGGSDLHVSSNLQPAIRVDGKLRRVEVPALSPAQLILKINKVIETVIAPELQKDGGDIELVDIADNKVYVKLQGRCSSCKNSILTINTLFSLSILTNKHSFSIAFSTKNHVLGNKVYYKLKINTL